MVEGILQPTPEGSPQGGPISPLLSNILLDDLVKELERRGLKFVRYADDFMIFVKSSRSAQRVFESVQRYLTQTLKLVVNQSKSRVSAYEGSSPDETWRRSGHGDQARSQPQELLADVSNTRHALRND